MPSSHSASPGRPFLRSGRLLRRVLGCRSATPSLDRAASGRRTVDRAAPRRAFPGAAPVGARRRLSLGQRALRKPSRDLRSRDRPAARCQHLDDAHRLPVRRPRGRSGRGDADGFPPRHRVEARALRPLHSRLRQNGRPNQPRSSSPRRRFRHRGFRQRPLFPLRGLLPVRRELLSAPPDDPLAVDRRRGGRARLAGRATATGVGVVTSPRRLDGLCGRRGGRRQRGIPAGRHGPRLCPLSTHPRGARGRTGATACPPIRR